MKIVCRPLKSVVIAAVQEKVGGALLLLGGVLDAEKGTKNRGEKNCEGEVLTKIQGKEFRGAQKGRVPKAKRRASWKMWLPFLASGGSKEKKREESKKTTYGLKKGEEQTDSMQGSKKQGGNDHGLRDHPQAAAVKGYFGCR